MHYILTPIFYIVFFYFGYRLPHNSKKMRFISDLTTKISLAILVSLSLIGIYIFFTILVRKPQFFYLSEFIHYLFPYNVVYYILFCGIFSLVGFFYGFELNKSINKIKLFITVPGALFLLCTSAWLTISILGLITKIKISESPSLSFSGPAAIIGAENIFLEPRLNKSGLNTISNYYDLIGESLEIEIDGKDIDFFYSSEFFLKKIQNQSENNAVFQNRNNDEIAISCGSNLSEILAKSGFEKKSYSGRYVFDVFTRDVFGEASINAILTDFNYIHLVLLFNEEVKANCSIEYYNSKSSLLTPEMLPRIIFKKIPGLNFSPLFHYATASEEELNKIFPDSNGYLILNDFFDMKEYYDMKFLDNLEETKGIFGGKLSIENCEKALLIASDCYINNELDELLYGTIIIEISQSNSIVASPKITEEKLVDGKNKSPIEEGLESIASGHKFINFVHGSGVYWQLFTGEIISENVPILSSSLQISGFEGDLYIGEKKYNFGPGYDNFAIHTKSSYPEIVFSFKDDNVSGRVFGGRISDIFINGNLMDYSWWSELSNEVKAGIISGLILLFLGVVPKQKKVILRTIKYFVFGNYRSSLVVVDT